MARLNDSEKKILDQIARWKAATPSFIARATEFVSKPITWLTDNLIPANIRSSVGDITDKIAERIQDLSQWTVNKEVILKATKEFEIDASTIVGLKQATIHDLDHVAQDFITTNSRIGTGSGAVAGIVGWAGLAADLPTLFVLALRSIYQIALCYGYDLEGENGTQEEKDFEFEYIMRVFKVATASDKVQKQKALGELKDFEAGRYDEDLTSGLGGDFTTKQVGKNTTRIISQRIIREIVEQTLSKKAAALVPGLGAIFNAGFNYVYLNDVGEAAFMLYRERFLLDKKGRKRSIKIEIE